MMYRNLQQQFNLNYKSSYGNQMKTLINSIELISMNYMGSSNSTMHKFGIEYGYIGLAMGNMLKNTNNNIKNIEINKTNAISIDANWWYVLALIGYIGAWIVQIISALGIPATLGLLAGAWLFSIFMLSTVVLAGVAHACGW